MNWAGRSLVPLAYTDGHGLEGTCGLRHRKSQEGVKGEESCGSHDIFGANSKGGPDIFTGDFNAGSSS